VQGSELLRKLTERNRIRNQVQVTEFKELPTAGKRSHKN